ncbi:MAG TPA: cache domain-containing protein [Bryobacteraceae bacterium]|nr:cache domain-containing protein [Bryobacteraceae bacterium]
MPLDRLEVRVSIQKVLLGLIIVIVPLSIIGLYLTTRTDTALNQSIGTQFKTLAGIYGNEVFEFFHDRVSDVATIAMDPVLVDGVLSADRGYEGQSESAIAAKIDKMRKSWSAPAFAGAAVKSILGSKSSEVLTRHHEINPLLLRLTATDERGITVGSTTQVMRYSYSDNEGWQSAYASGKGAVTVSPILYDDLAKAYYVNIGVPVTEPGSGRLAGVLSAAVNVSTLLSRFQQPQTGSGAKLLLVNEDGTIISGPGADVFARVRSKEFSAIGDSIGPVRGKENGYVVANLGAGPTIIGFADLGLKPHFSNLAWTVIVSQEKSAATASIQPVIRFALLMVLLGMLLVILLAVYYSIHKKQQFADIEEALPPDIISPHAV